MVQSLCNARECRENRRACGRTTVCNSFMLGHSGGGGLHIYHCRLSHTHVRPPKGCSVHTHTRRTAAPVPCVTEAGAKYSPHNTVDTLCYYSNTPTTGLLHSRCTLRECISTLPHHKPSDEHSWKSHGTILKNIFFPYKKRGTISVFIH